MNTKTAERLIHCYQPGHAAGANESRIKKAVKVAERDPELSPKLEAQIAFDRRIGEKVAAIEVPAELAEKMGVLGDNGPSIWKAPFKNPAVLAAILSLSVVAVLVTHSAMEGAGNFPGKEAAIQMVNSVQNMSGVEFEPIKPTELGKLNDWFAMNGMDRFETPPEFAGLKAVGCRVSKQSGFPVAQALVDTNSMVVFGFHGSDLGIRLDPPERWRTFVDDDWVAAVRGLGDVTFMIAFRGTKSDMEAFLANPRK